MQAHREETGIIRNVRVAVTGARGLLGAQIAECFKQLGASVTRIERGDRWPRSGVELLVHAAGRNNVDSGVDRTTHLVRDNVSYARFVAENICANRTIVLSSMAVYGGAHSGAVSENVAAAPANVHAMTKFLGEEAFKRRQSNLTILRLPTIMGVGSLPNFVTRAINSIVKEHPITVDALDEPFNSLFLANHVDDLIVKLFLTQWEGQYTLNVAADQPCTLREFYNLMAQMLGRSAIFFPLPLRRIAPLLVDNSQLKKLILVDTLPTVFDILKTSISFIDVKMYQRSMGESPCRLPRR